MNIWQTLKKPIIIQAPMEEVTDTVFRRIIAKCGKPDIFFTEFTSATGLCSEGKERIIQRLKFTKEEKPIIAQIWGNNPEDFYKAARMIEKMGFDGIDLNMGCPDRKVIKKGCGAALIENQKLAGEIIEATKKGAGNLPISIKTRLGLSSVKTDEWISFLLQKDLDAITIHGRTAKMMSKGAVLWEEIGKAVQMRNKIGSKTLIIGNGDVKSMKEAFEKYEKYNVDGIMIGRGIFDNLWIFDKKADPDKIPLEEKLKLLTEHIQLFEKTYKNPRKFPAVRKFFKIYISGFEGASSFRGKLMKTKDANEAVDIIKDYN